MPIPFTCPNCGNYTEADEKYAGQSGPCQKCGTTITVPAAGGPAAFSGAEYADAKSRSRRRTMIILIVVFLVVALVAAFFFLVMLPGIRAVGDAPRRVQCQNNLRQIALALQSYEAQHACFPPAYLADENGKPMHSWRVLILPQLEYVHLHDQYDFSEPWDSPQNLSVASQMPEFFRCPAAKGTAPNATSYMLVTGPDSAFEGDRAPKPAHFMDGTSRTILVVEVKGSTVTWTEPVDLELDKMSLEIGSGPGEIGSDHLGDVAMVVFADGHTQILSKDDLDPETLRAMFTPRGDESVGMEW